MSVPSRTYTKRPSWWPNSEAFALLDARGGDCRLSCWDPQRGLRQWKEPSYVRRSAQGQLESWGHSAALWQGRPGSASVHSAFAQGWPSEVGVGRWYLGRLAETYLEAKSRHRVFITEDQERRWSRRLWHECLEDSCFAVGGFLAPWQHELILATVERPDRTWGSHLQVELQHDALVWSFLTEGERRAGGRETVLSETRVLSALADYARRHLSVECAEPTLRQLLASVAQGDPGRRAESLRGEVSGRHLPSGLPVCRPFVWSDFFRIDTGWRESWQAVKSQIGEQAKRVGQVGLEEGPGLGLPGWRLLLSGELTSVMLESPLSRFLEEAR